MFTPRTPIYLSHAPTPRVEDFALLAALEAGIRGILLSVMPLVIYRSFGDAETVSHIYFAVGIASLCCGLMVPWATRFIPRRWMLTLAGVLYFCGMMLAIFGTPHMKALALLTNAVGTVTFTVCLNAYVLDYISRLDLGRNEMTRMVYSGASWALGPVLGVWLLNWWMPAPFIVAAGFAVVLIVVFWRLRLGNGKQIARARGPAPNPLAYLARFFAQPRLIAGWLFAVIRSCGWWVYVVYLPIYCIESGLGDQVGAVALSLSNGLLFITPLMLRVVRRVGVRLSVRAAFAACGGLFAIGWAVSAMPWAAYGSLMAASIFLVMLDVCGGLPFLMAVKPSERTEMAAVYSSFRDVSGILTPGAAALVLLVSPVSGIFAAVAGGMFLAFGIAGRLHPRLGAPRPFAPAAVQAAPAE
ncbi:MAG: MFS transporter [Limimaricola sp.]|uniref:MFS transporter n=1 Tax=Limimaricola sp. TaxID=2211665 RepID=UPI001E003C7B|nr:MFS transporter [Limimaricola sp.]MBI1418643.1 MFS transporter [Limimaricola sp.]